MTPSEQRYEPSAQEPLFTPCGSTFLLRQSVVRAGGGRTRDRPCEDAGRQARDLRRTPPSRGIRSGGGPAGVLVDEHLGSEVARRAKADGLVLAMPIEKSGTNLFELEDGKDYPEHLAAYDPDFFKVLVRYNPADEAADRTAQIERLAQVSTWAANVGWRWLFELLVPPTRDQLAQNEDQFNFDRQARPGLTAETISAFSKGGVHPTVWKLEGYETTEGAEEVLRAVAAQADGPSECIVLGRNALMEQVEHWLSVAAPLPGYAGFAVGRRSGWLPFRIYWPVESTEATRSQRLPVGTGHWSTHTVRPAVPDLEVVTAQSPSPGSTRG